MRVGAISGAHHKVVHLTERNHLESKMMAMRGQNSSSDHHYAKMRYRNNETNVLTRSGQMQLHYTSRNEIMDISQ
jgi:hypothetical protein